MNIARAGFHNREMATGVVLVGPQTERKRTAQHESATLASIAKRLANLKGYEFGGDYEAAASDGRSRYLVPPETLVGTENARAIGIRNEADLFGGIVPYPFMATKTITHPLVNADAARPHGWTEKFPERVKGAVLFGFAAFTMADLRLACAQVLERGPARLKPALGVGGRGQQVIATPDDAARAFETLDPMELSVHGVCIEENLDDVTTYSIGAVLFDELRITYCGTQRVTRDHDGKSVYGGSDLLVVRGDFDQLLRLHLTAELRAAIAHARVYDAAAAAEIPGFVASRRNYDVVAGRDHRGRQRCGVLEQSWRIGGASPAEVAALEALRADPALTCVRAACPEVYDARHEPPSHAHVSFRGEDDGVGALVKYSLVEKYGDTR